MSNAALETAIEAAWDARDTITVDTKVKCATQLKPQ